MDPRIRIHPKMSWIRNTAFGSSFVAKYLVVAVGEDLPEAVHVLDELGTL
jgi:hypothetical protein